MCIHAGRQRNKFGINDVSGATESFRLFLKDSLAQLRISGGVNPCLPFSFTNELFRYQVTYTYKIQLGCSQQYYWLILKTVLGKFKILQSCLRFILTKHVCIKFSPNGYKNRSGLLHGTLMLFMCT